MGLEISIKILFLAWSVYNKLTFYHDIITKAIKILFKKAQFQKQKES